MKEATKRASRKHYLRKLYGLTPEEYEAMLEKQKNLCAICNQPEKQRRALAVDHCHTTGKVRELLCLACNTALGKFHEDVEILSRAIQYIIKHSPGRSEDGTTGL